MSIKHRSISTIALMLIIVICAACGGPEQKKAKFYNKGKMLYEKGEYVKAGLEFKNAIQIDPKYADAYYMLGMVSLRKDDYRGAYEKFSKAVELSPEHWGAQGQLGKFLLAAGKTDEAMDKVNLILKGDAKNEDALILKAAVMIKKKDSDGAQLFLESIIGRAVRNPDGYLMLTSIYLQKGNMQKAEQTLRDGISVNDKAVAVYLALTELYIKQKKMDEAVGIMQKVIEKDPADGRHRFVLASIYWSMGKEQQASDILKAFVSAEPSKEERWIQVAQFYNLRNKQADAEQKLKEGISRNSKSFQIRFALSSFYFASNHPDQAISILQECLGLKSNPADPNILQTKNSLIAIYLARQEIDKAKRYVDEVLKESPKNVDANFAKGTIHLMKGEGGQAVSSFRLVVTERPQFVQGYIGLADAHKINKEPKLAFDTLQNALKTAPGSRDLLRALARLYAAQKDFKSAEAQYRKILDANSKDVEVITDLGDLMLTAGEFKRAQEEYSLVRKLAPNHPLSYEKLSALYIAQHQWSKAIAELDNILKIYPERWSTVNDLAYLLCEYGGGKKDMDRALTLIEKAVRSNPENPAMMDTLGWIYYKKGDMNQSLNWLAKAQARASTNPIINYHLGAAYYRAGNSGKAKEYLRISLAAKTGFPGKADAEKTLAGLR